MSWSTRSFWAQGQSGQDGENGFNGNSSLVNLTALSPEFLANSEEFKSSQESTTIRTNSSTRKKCKQRLISAMVNLEKRGLRVSKEPMGRKVRLIEQHQAPTSICPQGIVIHFGVDDGIDMATPMMEFFSMTKFENRCKFVLSNCMKD